MKRLAVLLSIFLSSDIWATPPYNASDPIQRMINEDIYFRLNKLTRPSVVSEIAAPASVNASNVLSQPFRNLIYGNVQDNLYELDAKKLHRKSTSLTDYRTMEAHLLLGGSLASGINLSIGNDTSPSYPITINRVAPQIVIKNSLGEYPFTLSVPESTDPKAFKIGSLGVQTELEINTDDRRTYLSRPTSFGRNHASNPQIIGRHLSDDATNYRINVSTWLNVSGKLSVSDFTTLSSFTASGYGVVSGTFGVLGEATFSTATASGRFTSPVGLFDNVILATTSLRSDLSIGASTWSQYPATQGVDFGGYAINNSSSAMIANILFTKNNIQNTSDAFLCSNSPGVLLISADDLMLGQQGEYPLSIGATGLRPMLNNVYLGDTNLDPGTTPFAHIWVRKAIVGDNLITSSSITTPSLLTLGTATASGFVGSGSGLTNLPSPTILTQNLNANNYAVLNVSSMTVLTPSTTMYAEGINLRAQGTTNNGTATGIRFGATNSYKGLIGFQRTGTNGLGDIVFAINPSAGSIATADINNDEKMRITSDGNVGIGTAAPDQRLTVAGGSISTTGQIISSGTGHNYFGGAIGIGGTPGTSIMLDITGAAYAADGDMRATAYMRDSTSFAAGVGGGIGFQGKYNTAGGTANFASIKGVKAEGTDGNYAGALVFTTTPNGGSPTERMRISSVGNVGIARTATTYALEISGNAGKTVGGTAWVDMSDRRLKTETGEITGVLSKIDKLRPIKYEWNAERNKKYGHDDGEKFGFVAQEMAEVFPNFVGQNNEGYYTYNPSGYEAVLTAAIKELMAEVNALKAEIAALKNK